MSVEATLRGVLNSAQPVVPSCEIIGLVLKTPIPIFILDTGLLYDASRV